MRLQQKTVEEFQKALEQLPPEVLEFLLGALKRKEKRQQDCGRGAAKKP